MKKRPPTTGVYFSQDVLDELRREAKRLDRSLPWVVRQAWKLARAEIMQLPSASQNGEPINEQSQAPQSS